MIMAQGDYLPGTYSRVGTEENPGTYFGGGAGGGTSQTMPPKVKKDLGVQKVDLKGIYQVYVLDADGSVEQEIVFECK